MNDKPAAILQMEIDTTRWSATKAENNFHGVYDETPWKRIYNIAKTAACDTVHNGGTFVIVSDPKRGKLTMVQRTDAEEL